MKNTGKMGAMLVFGFVNMPPSPQTRRKSGSERQRKALFVRSLCVQVPPVCSVTTFPPVLAPTLTQWDAEPHLRFRCGLGASQRPPAPAGPEATDLRPSLLAPSASSAKSASPRGPDSHRASVRPRVRPCSTSPSATPGHGHLSSQDRGIAAT